MIKKSELININTPKTNRIINTRCKNIKIRELVLTKNDILVNNIKISKIEKRKRDLSNPIKRKVVKSLKKEKDFSLVETDEILKLKKINLSIGRKITDFFRNFLTYLSSTVGLFILIILIFSLVKDGHKLLTWKLITSDYSKNVEVLTQADVDPKTGIKPKDENGNEIIYNLGGYKDPKIENMYFSSKWGIGLIDSNTQEGERTIEIKYLDKNSPIKKLVQKRQTTKYTKLTEDYIIDILTIIDASNKEKDLFVTETIYAKNMANELDNAIKITHLKVEFGGGGIRGSIQTTLYLILITLLISLPIGIISAIYLHEYAPQNKITNIIRELIDMANGIPSIIFGLLGVIIFIPFCNKVIGSDGGSIISGALTLTIILLPIIIKTTEEALKTVPDSYRQASLALGASNTQTVFKVVLPNSISGILTATLLSIGRIVGESAALIYAIGTVIKDTAILNQKSTSLAVHIWSVLAGENPNFEVASSIAIIILITVFILNVSVKLLSRFTDRKKVKEN